MSGDMMAFPDTVEEFMEQNKVVDREQVYSNGIEFVPIFRMQQWFDHVKHSPDDLRPVVQCCHCYHAERRNPVGQKTEIFCRMFTAGMRAHDYCSRGMKMEVTDDAEIH